LIFTGKKEKDQFPKMEMVHIKMDDFSGDEAALLSGDEAARLPGELQASFEPTTAELCIFR
jgi:hypothetical protein